MADKIAAKGLAAKKDEFVLLDVREADEVEKDGKIDGAINMPLGKLIRNVRQGAMDDVKDKTICTYCASGYRGDIGADELAKKGFKAVTIEGGYSAWKDAEKKNRRNTNA